VNRQSLARVFFGLTALAVLVGMAVQLYVSAGLAGTQFTSVGARIVNVFCYFTVQSNLLVGITTLLLAIRLDRPSTVFRGFRLSGLVAITVTFLIFHLILAGDQQLTGAAATADTILHTIVPILAVLGWVVFGPRTQVTWRVVLVSLAFPLWWIALALVRGPIVDFYAYPFIDVRVLGYPRVFVNLVLVAVLYLGLASLIKLAESVQSRGSRSSAPAPPDSPGRTPPGA
jgi:hypothetical protein